MHSCPDCGQACTCGGDIEDHENDLDSVFSCAHQCDDDEDDDICCDDDYYDKEDEDESNA